MMVYRRKISKLVIGIIVAVGFMTSIAESIRFDLESGHSKCISEDIKPNSMTVAKYSIVNPNDHHPSLADSHKLNVRVMNSASGNSYHRADNVEAGQFHFQAVEGGDYTACVWVDDHNPPVTVTVEFDWKSGVAAKDWTNVARKGSIDAMELEVKKLYETVTSVHEEMLYLRQSEEEIMELNSTTNSKMGWLSLLSLLLCLSVSGLQLWHLKSFFEKRKLI